MKSRRTTLCTLIAAATLFCAGGAAGEQRFDFSQKGFTGGGVISGYFGGTDLDNNGQISSFAGEVTSFWLSFSGDAVAGSFIHTLPDLDALVYDIGSGFLGDGQDGDGEGMASNWGGVSGFDYASGYGPTGADGGRVIDRATGAESVTQELIAVSQATVPEPSTFLLLAAGGGCLSLLRWKRNKKTGIVSSRDLYS